MRHKLTTLPFLTVLLLQWLAPAFAAYSADANRPPNIVLIFTDDQGYNDVGCFGSKTLKTPNLDRMAEQGRRFTSFYVAAPICSASRAALLTGSYCQRVGVTGVYFPNSRNGLNPDEVTIAEVLKHKGYATACVGKWHLGHHPKFLPTNQGFDSYFGIPYSNDMDGVRGKNRGLDRTWSENDFTPWNVPLLRDTKVIERPADQTTLTKRYTEEAVKFIKASVSAKKPFFLYMPHTMPHVPLFVSKDFYDPDPKSAYKKTIAEIDWSVGQVLQALKDAGVDDHTLVVFTTDNGPWHGKGNQAGSALPLRGAKFSTWEGGMRVPCIMRWPGRIKPGTTCDQIAATIDLLPTFAKIAGASAPTDRVIDGHDITALLTSDDAKTPHDAYYFYRGNQLQAVRSGKWKLHLPRQANRRNKAVTAGQLYDLSADIGESKNIAKAHPDVVKRLTDTARAFNEKLQANKRPAGKL